jgi:ribosome-binding factor A
MKDICRMSGTTRQQKYARLLQRELSDIFQRDKRGILDNEFVTIANVKINPDLSVAKVYISMQLAREQAKTLERINKRKSEIRRALGLKIGKQVRIVPELIFYRDEVEENAGRIDEIIRNLNISPDDEKKS